MRVPQLAGHARKAVPVGGLRLYCMWRASSAAAQSTPSPGLTTRISCAPPLACGGRPALPATLAPPLFGWAHCTTGSPFPAPPDVVDPFLRRLHHKLVQWLACARVRGDGVAAQAAGQPSTTSLLFGQARAATHGARQCNILKRRGWGGGGGAGRLSAPCRESGFGGLLQTTVAADANRVPEVDAPGGVHANVIEVRGSPIHSQGPS